MFSNIVVILSNNQISVNTSLSKTSTNNCDPYT